MLAGHGLQCSNLPKELIGLDIFSTLKLTSGQAHRGWIVCVCGGAIGEGFDKIPYLVGLDPDDSQHGKCPQGRQIAEIRWEPLLMRQAGLPLHGQGPYLRLGQGELSRKIV